MSFSGRGALEAQGAVRATETLNLLTPRQEASNQGLPTIQNLQTALTRADGDFGCIGFSVTLIGENRLFFLAFQAFKYLIQELILSAVVIVTSRTVVWLFLEQLWFEFVPVLHCLQRRLTAQS